MANAGRYRELYDKQHGLESNLFLAPGEGDKIEPSDVATANKPPAEPGLFSGPRL